MKTIPALLDTEAACPLVTMETYLGFRALLMCSISEENSSEKITEIIVQPVGMEMLDIAHPEYYRFTHTKSKEI